MTPIIKALAEVSDRYDALFCDLWGCLHNGVRAFPAAVAALQQFRAGGGSVVLLTNAPRPSSAVIRQLATLGVPDDAWDLVVSSGDASREAIFAGAVGRKIWHCGPEKDHSFFTDTADGHDLAAVERVDFDQAEGIVCTGLFDDRTETPEDYRPRFLAAKARGLKLACTNPDIVVDLGERRIYCAGALAALYTEMGGTSYYYGKPHPPVYDLARRRLGALRRVRDEHILAVGDGIATDIQGGLGEGFDTLFITGGLAAAEFGPDPKAPDPALVDAYFARHQMSASFAIPFLA